MKKYYVLAALALALSSCQQDEFLGNTEGYVQKDNQVAISFGGETSKITRTGEITGKDAAGKLNNKFVVFGYKTVGEPSTKEKVFDHYNVEWNTNNSSWEYIGKTKNDLNTTLDGTQTIKYWDYSATQYDFIAFSLGNTSNVKVKAIESMDNPTYELSGSFGDIKKCYIADRVTVAKDNFASEGKVKFTFYALGGTSVNIGIYETIEGYSIKEVKFYKSDNDQEPTATPTLYAESETISSITENGKLTITFEGNTAKVNKTQESESKDSKITFEKLSLAGKEGQETEDNVYLGRESSSASKGSAASVSPSDKIGALTLKVDYTLVSTDGSGETIKVTGATATIPDTYTKWENNCNYTYYFKITKDTNGSTGGAGGTAGLNAIQFDAAVTEKNGDVKNTTTWTEVKENGETTTTDPDQK